MHSFIAAGVEYRRFDHLFSVSRCGKFLRLGVHYTPTQRPDGYLGVGRRRLAHRVVAECWCVRPEGANHVHHVNHDKADNGAANLIWVTPKTHMAEHHPGIARGHVMSNEGKQRLRALRLGSVASEQTRLKQREASLRLGCRPPPRQIGAKCGVEALAKMRQNSPNATRCEVNGVVYPSFAQAGEALGEKLHTLRKRCLSQKFPEYRTLDRAPDGGNAAETPPGAIV